MDVSVDLHIYVCMYSDKTIYMFRLHDLYICMYAFVFYVTQQICAHNCMHVQAGRKLYSSIELLSLNDIVSVSCFNSVCVQIIFP